MKFSPQKIRPNGRTLCKCLENQNFGEHLISKKNLDVLGCRLFPSKFKLGTIHSRCRQIFTIFDPSRRQFFTSIHWQIWQIFDPDPPHNADVLTANIFESGPMPTP